MPMPPGIPGIPPGIPGKPPKPPGIPPIAAKGFIGAPPPPPPPQGFGNAALFGAEDEEDGVEGEGVLGVGAG